MRVWKQKSQKIFILLWKQFDFSDPLLHPGQDHLMVAQKTFLTSIPGEKYKHAQSGPICNNKKKPDLNVYK